MNETTIETTPDELLATLEIRKSKRPRFAGGARVCGTIAEHRFEALVFPEPADNRAWEVGGDSRISKLWLQRMSDRREVYNWDRGADVEPATPLARAIVDVLVAGLAELVFGT